ncbi:hypothetical protein [Salinicola aestuarinus]|uniref:hypothetical protein n=1 Tax=Salinicola aestuarinus TaxID=1949082 RepID=UPI0013004566|nr:hypothetical protein [Salinicola aestuarinus]
MNATHWQHAGIAALMMLAASADLAALAAQYVEQLARIDADETVEEEADDEVVGLPLVI